ncbi:N-acetyl-1-D-myo-inositol-2-amino-2-deoxy-alpha-D-glucopyranoside deacetylase [Corynebacterium sp. 335C]
MTPTRPDRDLAGLRVAAVHAHPDDEAIWTGGWLAQLARRGAAVDVVTCTLGELGEVIGAPYQGLVADASDQLGGFRVHELREALRELGVNGPGHRPRHLGAPGRYRDSGMAGSATNDDPRCLVQAGDAAVEDLVAELGALRPHLVVTYDADGGYGHPDHVRAHEITVEACARLRAADDDALYRTLWAVTDREALAAGLDAITAVPEGWTRAGVDDIASGVGQIAVELDDADVAAKVAAMAAHATQAWIADGRVSMVNPEPARGAHDGSGRAVAVWALSNLLCQPVTPVEHYRWGTAGPEHLAGVVDGAGAANPTPEPGSDAGHGSAGSAADAGEGA